MCEYDAAYKSEKCVNRIIPEDEPMLESNLDPLIDGILQTFCKGIAIGMAKENEKKEEEA